MALPHVAASLYALGNDVSIVEKEISEKSCFLHLLSLDLDDLV